MNYVTCFCLVILNRPALGGTFTAASPPCPGRSPLPGRKPGSLALGALVSGRVNSKRCCVLAPQVGEGDCGEETLEEQPILFELPYV